MLISEKQFLAERQERRLVALETAKRQRAEREIEGGKLDEMEKEIGGIFAGHVTPHGGCH